MFNILIIIIVVSISEDEIHGSYNQFLALLFFMFLLSTGGVIYSMFYVRRERKIVFYYNGEIKIIDKTLWNSSLPIKEFTWNSIVKVSMRIPPRTPKGPIVCYVGFYMNNGNYLKITPLDLPMYGKEGRKFYADLKEFLTEIGKENKLLELDDYYIFF
ncbi:hypothetical protein CW752_00585 [Chryseobacterium sp. PMSZPI]|nr:hypothetical protein CW752_00585 [Chryseobacterium sp. PMSZPI]